MKRHLAATAALAVLFGLAAVGHAQDRPKPIEYTLKGSVATWTSEGRSIDVLWPAAVKTLLKMGFRTTAADKPSGIIEAILDYSSGGLSIAEVKDDALSAVSIIMDESGGLCEMTVKLRVGVGYGRKEFFKEFFKELAANL